VWGCHHRDRGPHFGTPKFGDSDPLVCLRLGMSCAMRRTGARPDVRLTDLIAARGQAPDSRGTLVFFDGGGPVVPFRRPASLPRRISLRRAHAEESAEADRAGPLPGRQGHEEVHDAEKEGQGALAEAEAKQAARSWSEGDPSRRERPRAGSCLAAAKGGHLLRRCKARLKIECGRACEVDAAPLRGRAASRV
jgi:hypothetical protein